MQYFTYPCGILITPKVDQCSNQVIFSYHFYYMLFLIFQTRFGMWIGPSDWVELVYVHLFLETLYELTLKSLNTVAVNKMMICLYDNCGNWLVLACVTVASVIFVVVQVYRYKDCLRLGFEGFNQDLKDCIMLKGLYVNIILHLRFSYMIILLSFLWELNWRTTNWKMEKLVIRSLSLVLHLKN